LIDGWPRSIETVSIETVFQQFDGEGFPKHVRVPINLREFEKLPERSLGVGHRGLSFTVSGPEKVLRVLSFDSTQRVDDDRGRRQ
jgi:hypothetical protein